MPNQYDAILIGSGAGAAPVAYTLARAGKSVLMFEKGPLFQPQYQAARGLSDFKRDELYATGVEKRIQVPDVANWNQSYYSSHVEPDVNDEPHIYQDGDGRDHATLEGYTAQLVGGGTQLYGGVSLRYSPLDFRLKSFNEGRTDLRDDPNGDVQREVRDWPLSYDDFEPYYCKAEELIGINGTRENQTKTFSINNYQTPLAPNPISRYIEIGMDALGMPRYRTPLAVITEDHAPSSRTIPDDPETIKSGFVNRYGDPLGLKSSTWVTLLAPIYPLENFTLRPNCMVTHLESANGRVSRIHYRNPGGLRASIEVDPGTLVVVACSAIETVRLLKLSARDASDFDRRISQNDLLGKYFLTHCFGGAETVMPDRFDKSISLDSDWATDACASEDFITASGLWAGGAIYNNTSDQALPISLARTYGSQTIDTIWKSFVAETDLTGQKLVDFLDENFGTRLSVSFMANQVPQKTNRIELHPTVRDKWDRPAAYIIKDWHPHDKYLMDVFADQCANVLRFGGDPDNGQYPVEGKGGVYLAENALARMANHILGGARFGTDPADSVLDPSCRAWEFDNLYITDGAWMPTSGGANPTLTIEANSFRVADLLLERL